MSYIFISYFREDAEFVKTLVSHLEMSGISCWVDQSGMELGELWRERVKEKISQAGLFLLCLSQSYYERPMSYVHEELRIASARARTVHRSVPWILTIVIDGAVIPRLEITEDRNLIDYHVGRCNGDALEAAAIVSAGVKRSFENPQSNMGIISILAPNDFPENMAITCDGCLLEISGEWTPIEIFKRRFEAILNEDDGMFTTRGPPSVNQWGVVTVKPGAEAILRVSPGIRRLQGAQFGFSKETKGSMMLPIGPYRLMGPYHSNSLSVEIAARQSKRLLIQYTPKEGFLWWAKGKVDESYFLSEI